MQGTTIRVRKSAFDLWFLDGAADTLRALVNEHRASRMAVRVYIAGRLKFDGAMLSTQQTFEYGETIKRLVGQFDGETPVLLRVALK